MTSRAGWGGIVRDHHLDAPRQRHDAVATCTWGCEIRNAFEGADEDLLMPELYIAGKWTDARDGGRREIRCPADGTLVAEIDEASRPDALAAVEAARDA